MRQVPSAEVSKAFGKAQDDALADGGLIVTRHGRPLVVILPHAEYERLLASAAVQVTFDRSSRSPEQAMLMQAGPD